MASSSPTRRRAQTQPARKHRPQNQAQNPFAQRWMQSKATELRKASKPTKNSFNDRRLAEKNLDLSDADRYLMRLTRERTQRSRHTQRFNLLDTDEFHQTSGPSETQLPLAGSASADSHVRAPRALAGTGIARKPINQLDDHESDVSEEDEELFTRKPHTASAADQSSSDADLAQTAELSDDDAALEEQGNDEPRSKREVMQEVMQKSKAHKAQRQQEKYEYDEQTEILDKQLPELLTLLHKASAEANPRKQKARSLKKDPNDTTSNKPKESALFSDDDDADDRSEQTDPNDRGLAIGMDFKYETAYRLLANEKRSRPTDRMPTEEEAAQEERDRLLHMERKRVARMQSIEDEDELENSSQSTKRRKRQTDQDELNGSFNADYVRVGGELVESSGDSIDSDEDTPEDEVQDGEKSESGRKIDNDALVIAGATNSVNSTAYWENLTTEDIVAPSAETRELPFAFEKCPRTAAELGTLFDGATVAQRDAIVSRLRTCFAPVLDATRNRARLEVLTLLILERIERLADVTGTHGGMAQAELDVLLKHVHGLAARFERTVAAWARAKMLERYNRLTSFTAKGNTEPGRSEEVGVMTRSALSKTWTVTDIAILRAVCMLFPGSDARHPVTTPLVLLLGEAVSTKRMHTLRDAALGILVGSLQLEATCERRSYSPELAEFLSGILIAASGDAGSGDGRLVGKSLRRALAAAGGRICAGTQVKRESRLSVSYCADLSDEADEEVAERIVGAARVLGEVYFDEWTPHGDLVLAPLVESSGGRSDGPIAKWAMLTAGRALDGRQALELYVRDGVVVHKLLNPRLRAGENGAFRKGGSRASGGQGGGMEGMAESSKRVRRALRKEVRGLARDVRREARGAAAQQSAEEAARRRRVDKRDAEVRAFLAEQQQTWRQAEKRQTKLAGKQW